MYTESQAVSRYRPPTTPHQAGKVMVADSSIEATAANLAVDALVGLVVLPARCVPLDFTLIIDDLDTGTALVQDVGVVNAGQTDLTASTNFISSSSTAQAGGYVRATAIPDALKTPSDTDRIVAVHTTTGGVLPVKATSTVTSSGVNVTAANTVTVNGKVYTFVTPIGATEGNVLIGTDANASLANLFMAINRQDPLTNDGVKYKVAAAHTTVIGSNLTPTILTLEAIAEGAGGNAYTLAKSAVTLTVPALEFNGGVTAVPLQGGTIRGIMTYRAEEYDQ